MTRIAKNLTIAREAEATLKSDMGSIKSESS